jgi:hypothetical protein
MNTFFKRLALVGSAALVGILLLVLTASIALAQGPAPQGPQSDFGWGGHGRGMGGWRGMGPGMGKMGYNLAPSTGVTNSVPYGYGPGGCPGMGGWGYAQPGTGSRLTLDQAVDAVDSYLAAYGNADLAVAEVMEFTQNFYAEVEEESTGIHAFELLVDPYIGTIHPEPGPNMMWNTKYGHMGGRWGYGSGQPTADMLVSAEQAQEYAQQYLDAYLPGTTVASEADAFYGYYTLHVLQDGQIVGMLSVNDTTGQVWYHNWHGDFIGMTEGHD